MALNTLTLLCNHHHYSSSEVFSSCRTETLYLLNNNPSRYHLPAATILTFCLYEIDYSRYLIKVESKVFVLFS